MRTRSLLLSVLLLSVLCSCQESLPYGVLSESRMESVLVDYHLAQSMAESQSSDLAANRYLYVRAALDKHHVSEEQFDSSMVYWSAHAEILKQIYERVEKRVESRARAEGVSSEITNSYTELSADGDTANIWNMTPEFVVVNNVMENQFSFSMPADSTFRPGDTFLWSMKPLFYNNGTTSVEAYASLLVEFDNDSIVGTTLRVNGDYMMELHIRSTMFDPTWNIRRVFGTIYLPTDQDNLTLLYISHVALVRYHRQVRPVIEDMSARQMLDADTLRRDSAVTTEKKRLSPHDVRGSEPHDRTIQIIKDKPQRFGNMNTRRKVVR